MTTIAQLGIEINSDSAAAAKVNLQGVAAAASDAESAAGGTTSAFSKVGKEFEDFAVHARRHILSLAGANEATRAFAGILAELPFALLAAGAAIVALAVAYQQGAGEANDYAKAIAASGNAAGVTAGQLAAYAQSIGAVSGNTHQAAQALAALVATGAVGKDNLQQFAAVAVQASRTLGISFADIAKDFADLSNAPLDGATKLGKQLGFLTPALYEQIRALQSQGNATAAADVAQTALAASLQKQSAMVENYSSVWESLGHKISSVWSSIQNLGRGSSPEVLLATLLQQQQDAKDRFTRINGAVDPNFQGSALLQREIADTQRLVDLGKQQADAQKDSNTFTSDYLALLKAIGVEAANDATITGASFAATASGFSDSVKVAQAAIQNQQDLLEAQHDAALISDAAYYDKKRALIEEDAKAEIAGLEAQNSLLALQIENGQKRANLLKSEVTDPGQASTIQAQADADAITKQAQIASNNAAIAIATTNASAKVQLANGAQVDSQKRLTASYNELVTSAQKYEDSLTRQYKLTLQGIGQGNAARDRANQISDIQGHFDDQQSQLQSQLDSKQIDKPEFDKRQAALQSALKKSLSSFDDYYANLQQKQGDWVNGAKEAFANYIDAAKNVADLSDKAFTDAFGQIEDSLVTLATTGKFSFKDLANSILGDLVRMETKILESQALQAILGAFAVGAGAGSLSGSSGVGELTGGGVQFAANGGNPSAGQPFIVGENGPELFVPSQGGTIIPNNKLGGGAGVSFNSVNNFGSGSQVGALTAELDRRDANLRAQFAEDISRGRLNSQLRNARF